MKKWLIAIGLGVAVAAVLGFVAVGGVETLAAGRKPQPPRKQPARTGKTPMVSVQVEPVGVAFDEFGPDPTVRLDERSGRPQRLVAAARPARKNRPHRAEAPAKVRRTRRVGTPSPERPPVVPDSAPRVTARKEPTRRRRSEGAVARRPERGPPRSSARREELPPSVIYIGGRPSPRRSREDDTQRLRIVVRPERRKENRDRPTDRQLEEDRKWRRRMFEKWEREERDRRRWQSREEARAIEREFDRDRLRRR